MALPDDLQLHRRLPARHPHHPGDPRGRRRDRGATRLSEPSAPGATRTSSIRTDGAARGNPGPGVARRGADRRSPRRTRCDPSRRPGRDDLGRAGRPDEQRRRVHGRRPGARARPASSGAEKVDLLLDSKLIVEQLHGPLAGQGREAAAAVGRGEGDAGGLPALVGDPRAAGPELDGRRARQRGARPGRGGRPGVGVRAGRRSDRPATTPWRRYNPRASEAAGRSRARRATGGREESPSSTAQGSG